MAIGHGPDVTLVVVIDTTLRRASLRDPGMATAAHALYSLAAAWTS